MKLLSDRSGLKYLTNSLAEPMDGIKDIDPVIEKWYHAIAVEAFNARLYLVEFNGFPGVLSNYEICDKNHCEDMGKSREELYRLLAANLERVSERHPYKYFQLFTGWETGLDGSDELAIFFPYPTPTEMIRSVIEQSDDDFYCLEEQPVVLEPEEGEKESLYRIFLTMNSDAAEIDDLDTVENQLSEMGLRVESIKSVHSKQQLLSELPDVVPGLASFIRNTLIDQDGVAPVWDELEDGHPMVKAALKVCQSDGVEILLQQIRKALEEYTDKVNAKFMALALIEWCYLRM